MQGCCKNYKEIGIFYIGYVTVKKIATCNNVNSVNPLHLMIGHYEEKNENKYLVLDDVDENKEISKKYEEVWESVKKDIKAINVAKELNMEKILKKLDLSLMMTCQ